MYVYIHIHTYIHIYTYIHTCIWAPARARHLYPVPLPCQSPVYNNMVLNNIVVLSATLINDKNKWSS